MTTSARKAMVAAIETQASTVWVAAGGSSTTIDWPGVSFAPTPTMVTWLRISTLFGRSELLTTGVAGAGTGYDEVPVVVKLSVFSKPGDGVVQATGLCDALVDGFQRQTIGGVRFLYVQGPVPVDDPDGWEQRTITCTGYAEQAV